MEPDFDNDIPLQSPTQVAAPAPTPHPTELIEEASKVSPLEWEEKYKVASAEAYQYGISLLEEDETNPELWKLWAVEEKEEERPLRIMQRLVPSNKWSQVYRVEGIIKGRAERYAWIFQDHDKETRMMWDTEVESVQQLETYRTTEGDIDVVKCEVKLPWMMSNRLLLGVQSCRYTENGTHTYAYQTSDHYYFTKHFKETVHQKCYMVPNCIVFIWLCPLNNGLCSIKMIVCLEPGPLYLAAPKLNYSYPWKLIDRVRLWEHVVDKWREYYPLDPKLVENRK